MDFIKLIGVILVVTGVIGMSFWIWLCLQISAWLDEYEEEYAKKHK